MPKQATEIPRTGEDLVAALCGEEPYRPLREALVETFGTGVRATERLRVEKLDGRAYRVELETSEHHSVVLKIFRVLRARRNELVLNRWLPAVGLSHLAPRLLAVAPGPDDSSVWHVYEDCGDVTLADREDPGSIRSALRAIGRVHAAFVEHPLLEEITTQGKPPGNYFFDTPELHESVRASVERLNASKDVPRSDTIANLADCLAALAPVFANTAPISGPQTLLHGDLYPSNIVVSNGAHGDDEAACSARLIDWDRAGIGPFLFDLAFIVGELAPEGRQLALSAYRESMEPHLTAWPTPQEWQQQFKRVRMGRIVRAIETYVGLFENGNGEYAIQKFEEALSWLTTETADELPV